MLNQAAGVCRAWQEGTGGPETGTGEINDAGNGGKPD